MRALICGGRDFRDRDMLFATMDRIHAKRPISMVIHGGANGADYLAGRWAAMRGIPIAVFHADWDRYRRAAGPIRNAKMLADGKPDVVFAFPGGTGTRHMKQIARAADVPVEEIMGMEGG